MTPLHRIYFLEYLSNHSNFLTQYIQPKYKIFEKENCQMSIFADFGIFSLKSGVNFAALYLRKYLSQSSKILNMHFLEENAGNMCFGILIFGFFEKIWRFQSKTEFSCKYVSRKMAQITIQNQKIKIPKHIFPPKY